MIEAAHILDITLLKESICNVVFTFLAVRASTGFACLMRTERATMSLKKEIWTLLVNYLNIFFKSLK